MKHPAIYAITILLWVCAGPFCAAQDLPEAPSATVQFEAQQRTLDEQQSDRVMGVVPSLSAAGPGAEPALPTIRQRFIQTSLGNFDANSLIVAGLFAAEGMAANSTPEFHQGMVGYGRYYWHTLATEGVENYFVEFIIPVIDHQDTRYHAMGKGRGGFLKRTGYSLSRVVATRSYAGEPMFNYAEIAGSAVTAGISSFYYPAPERTVANGLIRWGSIVGIGALSFMIQEFWPDVHHGLFPGKDRADSPPATAMNSEP